MDRDAAASRGGPSGAEPLARQGRRAAFLLLTVVFYELGRLCLSSWGSPLQPMEVALRFIEPLALLAALLAAFRAPLAAALCRPRQLWPWALAALPSAAALLALAR